MLIATRSKIILYQMNTQAIFIQGLQDNITEEYLNGFVLTASLIDKDGNSIVGCQDIVFVYQALSNGTYTSIFGDGTFQPGIGTGYTLLIDGNDGVSWVHVEFIVEIQPRQQ